MLCCTALPAAADNESNYYNQQTSNSIQNLVKYFQYFGAYLGYDVTQNPNEEKNLSRQALIDMNSEQVAQLSLFNTYVGAIPVNALSEAFSHLVPTGTPIAVINSLVNTSFKSYNAASSQTGGSGSVSISPLIDQEKFQLDPVNQAVLNILGTPDYSYCLTGPDSNDWNKDCPYPLFDTNIPAKVIGDLPDPKKFFNYTYIEQFLGQLNSNALTAPLLYSTENQQLSPQQQQSQGKEQNKGLTAQNQAQVAANFIRYVSGAVTPIKLPRWADYQNLYTKAVANTESNNSVSTTQKYEAQAALSNYLASLRTYAAQNSVGVSNLYFILSKRLPQKPENSNTSGTNVGAPPQPPMSQALSEFNMATWRIYNPANADNSDPNKTQWINKINQASTATVQKEIAILLAELSYQMYLDRQLQERILLTNSIMLLQNTKLAQPNTLSTPTNE